MTPKNKYHLYRGVVGVVFSITPGVFENEAHFKTLHLSWPNCQEGHNTSVKSISK